MWPFERKKAKIATVNFSDILTGMQSAISQVQDMLQNRQLQNLSNFWQPDGTPVTQTIKLEERTIDVPLVTLVPHSQLAMDTVEIKFSTRVGSIVGEKTSDLLKSGMVAGDNHEVLSHAAFEVAMGGVRADGEDAMQVSIIFKVKDTPEAVSRLLDEYNKTI